MGDSAITVIEEQLQRSQEEVIDTAVRHVSDNLDMFPGAGFGFVKRSIERRIRSEIEDNVAPQLDAYRELQLEYIDALAGAENTDAVHEQYRDELMEIDPFLTVLDPSSPATEDIRQEAWENGKDAAEHVAAWITDAERETFDDFSDLIHHLGKTPKDVEMETEQLLFYIDMMEQYRDHLDLSAYSAFLEQENVHDWFLQHLPTGLKHGRDAVMADVQEQLAERQGRD